MPENNKDNLNKFAKLQTLVQCQSGWSLSTCGVEELISEMRMLFAKHRKSSAVQRWIDECEIISSKDLLVADVEVTAAVADKSMDVYGAQRRSRVVT